ncbi:MAG: hypothetical protein ACW99Q_17255 [Candidatus Kariarchaeaceae archaeon]
MTDLLEVGVFTLTPHSMQKIAAGSLSCPQLVHIIDDLDMNYKI